MGWPAQNWKQIVDIMCAVYDSNRTSNMLYILARLHKHVVYLGPHTQTCCISLQRQPSSGSAWPACPKKRKIGPPLLGAKGSTQFARQFVTPMTAPPLVGCVVWSLSTSSSFVSSNRIFPFVYTFSGIFVELLKVIQSVWMC